MEVYIKYIVIWAVFMALIAGLAIIAPKIASVIDKKRASLQSKSKADDENLGEASVSENK